MLNEVLHHANLFHWAEAGLVIFFVVFVGTSIWTLTRPKQTIERWATLPLESDEQACARMRNENEHE